jgi:hypothetical protein
LTFAVAAVAGACRPDSALAPSQGRVSLEEALAELEVPALRSATASFTGIGLVPPAILPPDCSFEASSESFVCAPISASGVTLTRSFALVSNSGARQSAFDRSTTSWLRTSSTVAGTMAQTGSSAAVDGRQELILSGLLGDRHTINGSSTTRVAIVRDGSSSSQPVVTTVTTKITDVVLPVALPGDRVAWPLSGMMEIQSSIDMDYPPPLPAPGPIVSRVIVLFSGTSVVDVAITVRGATHICTANLASEGLGCSY